MATIDQLFPGEYVKAGEFNGKPVTLTIKEVARKPISDGLGGEEPAVVATFEDTEKKLILNKTNAVCLRAMFGEDSDEWAGHAVTLHPVNDESGLSDSGHCIRVKGSPELDKQVKFQARLGRRMVTQTMVPTKASPAAQKPESTSGEGVAVNAETGEVMQPGEPQPEVPNVVASEFVPEVPQDEML